LTLRLWIGKIPAGVEVPGRLDDLRGLLEKSQRQAGKSLRCRFSLRQNLLQGLDFQSQAEIMPCP
jgi:hypothetical protein